MPHPRGKPWTVVCYSCNIEHFFSDERLASYDWVQHNKKFHNGELVAYMWDGRNR